MRRVIELTKLLGYLPISNSEEEANIYRFSPELTFIILNGNPYLTLFYQFTFSNLTEKGPFLARLPLLQRIRTHTLGVYIAYWIFCDLFVEGAVSLSADFYRDVDLLNSWGLNAALRWYALEWLDFRLYFNYFTESPAGVVGRSYNIGIAASVHWL